MRNHHQNSILFVVFFVIAAGLLAGCGQNDLPEPTAVSEEIVVGEKRPFSSSTPTPIPPTQTPTATPEPATPNPTEFTTHIVSTNTPNPIITATQLPKFQEVDAPTIPEEEPFWADLKSQGYEIFESAAVIGPKDYIYAAYLVRDPESYDVLMGRSGSEACRLAIYRFSEENAEFIQTFETPGQPATCRFNWAGSVTEKPEFFTKQQILGISGYWSDINQNEHPEIGIYYNYCFNACIDEGIPDIQFYEIESTFSVNNITNSLPGRLVPSAIWSSPYLPDLPVLEVQQETKWFQAESFWQFGWDGTQYVDQTYAYQQAYLENALDKADFIQNKYSDESPKYNLEYIYEILFSLEKAGLTEEGYDLFMELTEPENWLEATDSDIELLNWTRTEAENDFINNRKFVFRLINCEIDPTLGFCP